MSQKKIGAKIVIDGEQEFRSALTQSKNALKEFDSEMKLVTSQFKDNEKSMEALKAKQAVYQKQQQELTKQSKILVEQIQKASVAYKEASEAQVQQAEKIKRLEKALEEAKKEYGESADEVKQLEAELAEANQEYEKQERQITSLSNKITKWNTDLNKTQTELLETDRALDQTNDAIENFDRDVDEVEADTKKFGISIEEAGKGTEAFRVSLGSLVSAQVVVDVLRNCASAIKDVATAAIDVGMKFESSMSNVEALSGASGDALERLSAKAKEMGATTMFSASQSADAMSYMALAGWDVEQMLDGINPVLQLAAAANMDLAEASDIVTDYITAFGLKASDAAHFSDVMATAMSTSNTNVELLGESYKNCAATCGSMGIAMEDATAVLATMANAGVKGGEAGTALNAILTRLATNTKGAADALSDYGVEVYDSEGNMNSLSSILNGLGEVWGELSDQEQSALAKTIAGTSQYSKFQTIMLGVSDAAKEGGMSFNDYADSLRNCDGAAEAMAKTMQDNLAGDITILQSALEGLGIATEGVFDAAFREAVQGATDAVSQLEKAVSSGDLGVSLSELGDAIAEMTSNLIDAATDALPGFIDKLTWIVNNVDYIGAGLTTLVAGLVSYKVATIASTLATEGLTVALNLNPFVLAATAIATLTAGVIKFCEADEKAKDIESEFTKELEHFNGTIEQTIDSIDDSRQKRKDETDAMDAQLEVSKRLSEELFNESTANEQKAAIIAKLKELYPQLNLAMNEQGEIMGSNKQQVDDYIESSIKLAKVEAAREHLTEIAKDQFEAEMKLSEAKQKLAESSKDLSEAERNQQSEQEKLARMFPDVIDAYNEYDSVVKHAKEAHSELIEKQAEAEEEVKKLGEEYNQTMAYINDNTPLENATSATEELGEAEGQVIQFTEEMENAFDDLQKSLSDSISSSLDLTSKWATDWQATTAEMTQNIESQIAGIEEWKENFQTLADSSEVAIDKRVLKYLADMGTDGAGLVKELTRALKESPEELQGWADDMKLYLSLEDDVAEEITESYVTAVNDSLEAAAEALETGSSALTDAEKEMAENLERILEDAKLQDSFKKAGEEMPQKMAEGIKESSEEAKKAAETTASDAAKEADKKKSDFKKTGNEYVKNLAAGLKIDDAKNAAYDMATSVRDTVMEILSMEAGYDIGEAWMVGLANAIRDEGDAAVAAARSKAEEAKAALQTGGGSNEESSSEESSESAPQSVSIDSMSLDRLAERLSTPNAVMLNNMRASVPSQLSYGYLPLMDSINGLGTALDSSIRKNAESMRVNVQLMGEAKDIFNVVNTQNTKLVNATGYHALS